jgi:hypothetical protein
MSSLFVAVAVSESEKRERERIIVCLLKILIASFVVVQRAECDVVYNGGFKLTIATSVLGVSVSMAVALEHLSGRVSSVVDLRLL